MELDIEIEKAVRKIVYGEKNERLTEEEINELIADVRESANKKSYNFAKMNSLVINQHDKKRQVKQYADNRSIENVLSQCIKQIIDKTCKIKYPNRKMVMKSLFGVIKGITSMIDFTIYKFDFKDFFNTISTEYVYEKYLKSRILDRNELNLIKTYSAQTKYTYAGLKPSNSFAEIIGKAFDEGVLEKFFDRGLIYYERYVDDCIIVFNQNISEVKLKSELLQILNITFFDDKVSCSKQCKTKFNNRKSSYVSRRTLLTGNSKFDYLGYQFTFFPKGNETQKKIEVQYGISKAKQEKYQKRINGFVKSYKDIANPSRMDFNLLRLQVLGFTCREVYVDKKQKNETWVEKGIISNYSELRYLESNKIDEETNSFLAKCVYRAFNENKVTVPSYARVGKYNLSENLKRNRTFVLVEHIGYDYKSLSRLCEKIGIEKIDARGHKKNYEILVQEFLIKIKVGY